MSETNTTNGNGNGATKGTAKQANPQLLLKSHLENLAPAMRAVLPRHVTPERMTKVVLSGTARNPALLRCTMASIVRSVMQAAELGLEIGGLLGEAYLVPYKRKWQENGRWMSVDEAQCIVGYQGLLKLARQSGEVVSIVSRVVREGERVTMDIANNTVTHPFTFTTDATKPVVGVYALAVLTSGERVLEPMVRTEVDLIRSRSKAADNGPWVTDYDEMARKTALRRLCKYLPKSAEKVQRALELDIESESDTPVAALPLSVDAKPSRTEALTEALMQKVASVAAAESGEDVHAMAVQDPAAEPDECPSGNPDEGP